MFFEAKITDTQPFWCLHFQHLDWDSSIHFRLQQTDTFSYINGFSVFVGKYIHFLNVM